jgi:hypothetical protein
MPECSSWSTIGTPSCRIRGSIGAIGWSRKRRQRPASIAGSRLRRPDRCFLFRQLDEEGGRHVGLEGDVPVVEDYSL